ncbi:MAG: transcriptional repressor [Bacteroidales bacterium]|nr:transcriptional repressor [Bacteroidales bacterium]
MESVIAHLLSHNIKPSVQRLAIMKYLMEHKTHPTADMIYNDLFKDIPTLSKTTVYNTLKLLSENGAAKVIGIEEKNARYDGDMTPHAHFRCKNCGCIYDIPLEANDKLFVEGIGELIVDEVHIYYKGYCKECAEAMKN